MTKKWIGHVIREEKCQLRDGWEDRRKTKDNDARVDVLSSSNNNNEALKRKAQGREEWQC